MENLFKTLTQFKPYIIECIFVVLAIISAGVACFLFLQNPVQSKATNFKTKLPVTSTKNEPVNEPKMIMVDISGSVINPDSYAVTDGARLKDVLKIAGGLSERADKEFFSRNFNLASFVTDQEKIHIPSVLELSDGIFRENLKVIDFTKGILATTDALSTGKIHINTDSSQKLMDLPGIGQVVAAKIIQNRPFTTINELLDKKILKQSVFNGIKELIDL